MFICKCVSMVVYPVKVSGVEHIPAEGAFILCSNHIHSYDPAVLALCIRHRQLRFMAKKEIFRNPVRKWFFGSMGAFPVDRKAADLPSYRNALKALKEGYGLLMFSQGTRMKELDINSAKGGVALFAVKANVPIIPAGIAGTYRPFSSLHVRFGAPIYLEEYYGKRLKSEQIDEIMVGIMSVVGDLTKKTKETKV